MKFTLRREPASTAPVVGGTPQVNLLPKKVQAAREQKALFATWGVRLGGAVGVLLIATVGMFAWRGLVALQLSGAQSEGQQLLSQVSEKAAIQQLLDTEGALETFARDAVAAKFNWTQSIGLLLQKFPEGAALCGFDLTAGDLPGAEPEEAIGLAGTVAICGNFSSAIPFLRDAGSVAGIKNVTAVEGTYDRSTGTYRHDISIEFNQTIYLSASAKQDASKEKKRAEPVEQAAVDGDAVEQIVEEVPTGEENQAVASTEEAGAEAENAE